MRFRPLLTLLIPLLLAGCGGSGGSKVGPAACAWHVQRSPDTSDDLVGVSFPDVTHGWVVGGIDRAVIETTSDGGRTWRAEHAATGGNGVSAVSFVDDRHGWAVGVHNLVLATSDGGRTWRHQDPHITRGDNLYGVAFVDTRHGWIDGAKGNVRVTADGGRTWTPQAAGTSEDLSQVGFTDVRNGFIVAGDGSVRQTHDGGRTWRRTYTSRSSEAVAAADFLDPTHGWEVGSETDPGANHSVSSQTSDGGASWQRRVLSSPDDIRFNAVTFADLKHGWVGTYQGDLLYTDDGGRDWAERNDPAEGAQVYGMTFRDPTHGWAVGASGTIMACTD